MNESASVAQIERDIVRTRADLSETLEVLQQRLSPSSLMNEAWNSETVSRVVRSATSGSEQFASGLGRSVRDNPLPILVTGIGLTWLALNSRDRAEKPRVYVDSPTGADRPVYRAASAEAAGAEASDQSRPSAAAEERLRAVAGDVRAKAERLKRKTEQVKQTAEEGAQRMQDELHRMTEAASDRVNKVTDAVKSGGTVAYERSRNAANWASDQLGGGASTAVRFIREYPIAAGAIALGVGAALALLFAPSRRERELLGEAGGQALSRVRETVHDTVEKAKSMAGSVADAAVETVRRQTKGAADTDESAPRASFAEPPVPEDRVKDVRESPLAYDPEAVSGAPEGDAPRAPV